MTIALEYPNAQAVAYAVERAMREEGIKPVSARPYNLHDPSNTIWWLVPATEWPAYKYGKFIFSPGKGTDEHIFCGADVEKGIDPSVKDVYPKKLRSFVIEDDWFWHTFLRELPSDSSVKELDRLAEGLGQLPELRVLSAITVASEDYDPYAAETPGDLVRFEAAGGNLKLISSAVPNKLLSEVSKATTLCELVAAINGIPRSEYAWVGIRIGAEFALSPDRPEPSAWTGQDLWEKLLTPLTLWFK